MDAQTGFLAAHSRGNERPLSGNGASHWIALVLCLAVLLGLHLNIAMTRSINWDEFHFLSRVHEFARGELTKPLQTFHVRFFAWLADLDALGVDQVLRARLFMFAALIATSTAIFVIARRFAEAQIALLCTLGYLASGYVLQHGTAFRYDPIVAAFTMTALAILARSNLRWPWLLAFGVALGMAFVVSIKMALYFPAFAGIAWLRWSEDNYSIRQGLRIALAPVLAAFITGLLFLWHSSGLAEPEAASRIFSRAGDAMFGLSRNIRFSISGVAVAVPTFALIALSITGLARGQGGSKPERIALSGMLLPLLALIFYTNTFPYFHAYIMAPVCAAAVIGVKSVVGRHGSTPIGLILALWAGVIWIGDAPGRLDAQRQLQAAANTMFPEQVKYFDFPGFLPNHSKANFFMSTWGLIDYMNGGFPTFVEVMEDETVPLIAAVDPQHNPTMSAALYDAPVTPYLIQEDVAAIRDTYRQIWGPFWVAGIELKPGEQRDWQVRVPGTYTAEGTIEVAGAQYQSGETLILQRGNVPLRNGSAASAGLLFGDNIKIPSAPPPARPYWAKF